MQQEKISQFISVTIRPRLKTLSLAIPLSSYLTKHKITVFTLIIYIYIYMGTSQGMVFFSVTVCLK